MDTYQESVREMISDVAGCLAQQAKPHWNENSAKALHAGDYSPEEVREKESVHKQNMQRHNSITVGELIDERVRMYQGEIEKLVLQKSKLGPAAGLTCVDLRDLLNRNFT